ncbi:MAG: ribonuclease J [Patescibacteria group bacterium]|jgi:ribonuclease J|nr:ribonuclease J [Patescibacteria group bacterium]
MVLHKNQKHPSHDGQNHKEKQAHQPLTKDTRKGLLKITPLGGLGEVGKNLTVYEYEDDIIIVDMGFMFPSDEMLGVDYLIPDISYLEDKKDKIRGILITHGHEDHIGAIPYIWNKLSVPIYGTKLTLGLIESKLSEFRFNQDGLLHVIDPDKDHLKLGVFDIEWFRVTHSIPDAVGVSIKTPLGRVIYTGDFKIDHSPLDNKYTDLTKLSRFGHEGVLLLLSDSTNAEQPGYSMSEKSLEESFENIFEKSQGRIIIASFASQINRIQMVIDSARDNGRKLAFSGRSLLKNVEIAVRLGYLKIPQGLIVRIQDINKYPDKIITVMSTGSQGESMSALSRMARGEHKNLKVKKGDTVIFSSSPIPGNESSITSVMDDLFREGVEVVFDAEKSRTHVSGHPCQEELKLMIALTRPKYFAPWHGERHMLVRHAKIAHDLNIPEENIFVLDNGDSIEVTNHGAKKSDSKVTNGVVLVDGFGIGDVGEIVLRERKSMSTEGIFVVICTVSKNDGRLLTSPDIISRGFIYMRENEQLVNNTRKEVKRIVENYKGDNKQNWQVLKVQLREAISEYLYNETQRKPLLIPVVIEV